MTKQNHEDDPQDRSILAGLNRYERLIDKQLADAMERGLFDNLEGTGKPLEFADESSVPEEERVAYRMLKNAGFAPPWVEIRQQITEEEQKLQHWLERANRRWPNCNNEERQKLRDDYQTALKHLNRLITNFNLTAPPVVGQLPLLQAWRELKKLGS
ncbi:MAG: DUF1992 domain-containing protein [Chloroflexaceae bacterium]|jgi:hypothetical protein|nr:DUF1992 domain-containing protein [Chloroflexaceae bacterium]